MTKKPPKDGPDKLRPDVAETAYRTMLEATGQAPKTVPGERPKNSVAAKRGRAGGLKGGKARTESLTERQLKKLAQQAAKKRWADSESA